MDLRSICEVLLVSLAFVLPQRARANMETCSGAHAAGQRAEQGGHLKDALASFQECAADAECPLPIRNECTSLYSKVEQRLPTVVFSVVDDKGNDVTDVRITSGDTQLANGLDGRPVTIDPGQHELRFELASGEVLSKSVVVRQGEKDRMVSVTLPRSDFGATAASTPAQPAPKTRRYHVPLASWIAYGVGVAALASWGSFGLVGRNKEQGLVDCSPNCSASRNGDYDAMKRDYLIADISVGVAGAAIIAGTVILLTKGRNHASSGDVSAKSKKVSVSPVAFGREGGGLMLGGRY